MNNIQYQIHLLLNSKYRLFVHLIIISLIYLFFYGNNILYCMNDTNNIVEAPTSQTSHSQSEDLRREITAFADSQASLLEEINRKNEYIQHLLQSKNRKTLQIIELRQQNGALGRKIHELREANMELSETNAELLDNVNNNYDAYKKQCKISGRLGNQVGDLKQELREKNAEISQLRSSVRLLGDSLATRK